MFLHKHPYEPFLFPGVRKVIVGTLPPPRFSLGQLKDGDVDFCYGSRDGQLWKIIDRIHDLDLLYETSEAAIQQRIQFLKSNLIGICDIVSSAVRHKIDASDMGMQEVRLRDMLYYLQQFSTVETLLLTGGNSKNGPEYFLRKQLREHQIKLRVINDEVPRIHCFVHPTTKKSIRVVSLTAPSGAANRAVGSLPAYKTLKRKNPEFNTIDFRILQYQVHFKD